MNGLGSAMTQGILGCLLMSFTLFSLSLALLSFVSRWQRPRLVIAGLSFMAFLGWLGQAFTQLSWLKHALPDQSELVPRHETRLSWAVFAAVVSLTTAVLLLAFRRGREMNRSA